MQMWELATGKIVFSAVFPAFLTCVTTDACERAVFVGGGDGVVYGVDLLSPQVSHAMERASTVHCSDRSFVGHTYAPSPPSLPRFCLPLRFNNMAQDGNYFRADFC